MTGSRRRLGRRFFARPAAEVAPDLLGRLLVREMSSGRRLSGRIVETEAYEQSDPASHSYRGRTERNGVMFGGPGLLYVYFTYGMHFCMNVVTGPEGVGSAVLLRAVEPLDGIDLMARRRSTRDLRLLCSGPARMCQAFGVARRQNGLDLVAGSEMHIEAGIPAQETDIAAGSRVGVRDGVGRDWRFRLRHDEFVSRARPGMPATRTPR
ncbi:MAG: DNA-3-methyladenine glycosylase [Actinomycetota bacterium]